MAKCVSEHNYNIAMRQATSLQWVYDKIRKYKDIQNKGVHFFDILDITYDSSTMTPVSFYNQYRGVALANIPKTGDIISGTSLPTRSLAPPLRT